MLLKEGWTDQVEEKANYLKQEILKHPAVKEVREAGLLLAVELGEEGKAEEMVRLLLEEGAMSDWFLYCDSAFRISPPLCINREELELTVQIVMRALNRLT